MLKQSPQLLATLLVLLCMYATYYYVTSQILVSVRTQGETEYRSEIRNPLTIIFLGSMHMGENRYSHYDVVSRFTHLFQLVFFISLITATAQFYVSRGKKTSFLLFVLITEFWLVITVQVKKIFYYLYSVFNPEQQLFPGSFFSWLSILHTVVLSCGLYYILSVLIKYHTGIEQNQTSVQHPMPLKWMRPFHYVTDRLVILTLVYNAFIYHYFANKFNAGFSAEHAEGVYEWGAASLLACVIVGYFITETLFQLSPSKVLTGTWVVAADGSKPGMFKIFKRSLSRIIPFNPLSFLAKNSWHDSLSQTTLGYSTNELWLSRQTRIMRAVFIIGLILCILLVVCIAVRFTSHSLRVRDIIVFPLSLAPLFLLYMMLVFTCWIASTSNFAHNLYEGEFAQPATHFWSALCLWIPLFNFKVTGSMLNDISFNLSTALNEESSKEFLEQRTAALRKGFTTMNICIIIFVLLMLKARYWNEIFGLTVFMTIAVIVWCTTVIRFASAINHLAPELSEAYKNKVVLPLADK